MSLPALADLVASLEVRLGVEQDSLQDADLARAEGVLADASALVTSELGGVIPDPCPPAAVAMLLAAAKRAFLNPADAESETVGGVSTRFGASGVVLTDAERAVLVRSRGTAGIWSLGTTRGDTDMTLYVFDQYASGLINGGDALAWETRVLP